MKYSYFLDAFTIPIIGPIYRPTHNYTRVCFKCTDIYYCSWLMLSAEMKRDAVTIKYLLGLTLSKGN